ncbi:hypothetical protein GCK32_005391 [Trichostrongylus colubriformis]|uniref:HTH OST-type domain-containing protein n=1 Tax=Trichostrongylus colubriformis TaxID=6319 RepID=A0AAN8ING1_TRICO
MNWEHLFPQTTLTLLKAYSRNLLGYSLVTAAFETGFVSVDDLLSQSPNIVCTYIQSKKHYKVEATAGTEATRDISALIRHQGKKKRKHVKQNTAHREYLNRNVTAARSFRSKSTYGVGFVESSYDTSNDLQPGTSLQRARNVSSACSVTKPSQSNSRTANNKQKLDEQASSGDKVVHSPVVGVQRFLKALKACNGTASSDQLRAAYKMIHNTDWDVIECVKYFGTSSTREMIDAFLKDVVSIVSIKGTGRRLYVLKTEEQGSGNTERQNIIRAGNITRAELFDGLVNILVERYPETVHVNSISKAFLDKYGVSIEPETYLRLPWDKYILKFFSGQIEVDVKGNVSLNTKNPMVNDKLLKKSLNDALEAPIDSDTDSSFYSSDDEVVDDSLSRRLPNHTTKTFRQYYRSVNFLDLLLYAIVVLAVLSDFLVTISDVELKKDVCEEYHCKSMPCAGRGSARPFDRFSKVSRSFHGSSKASCSGDTPDSCSDLAGAGLTNVEPSDLHVVVTRGSGGRYAYMSERTSIASPSTSKESSSSKSTFTSTEPTSVELPSASRISVSSRMAQRLSFDRRLHQKTLASVGDFFQRKNAGEVPKPSLASRVAFPVGNSTLERRFALGHQSKQAQEDVECAHPYYNVHCISKSGDARMWAAKKGLTVKKDSAPNERLIW